MIDLTEEVLVETRFEKKTFSTKKTYQKQHVNLKQKISLSHISKVVYITQLRFTKVTLIKEATFLYSAPNQQILFHLSVIYLSLYPLNNTCISSKLCKLPASIKVEFIQ